MIQQKKKGILYKIRKNVIRFKPKPEQKPRIHVLSVSAARHIGFIADIACVVLAASILLSGVLAIVYGYGLMLQVTVFYACCSVALYGVLPLSCNVAVLRDGELDYSRFRENIRIIRDNSKLPVFWLPFATYIITLILWRCF